MTDRTVRRLAWITLGVYAVVGLVTLVASWRDEGLLPLIPFALAGVGTLILVKTRNPIGWLFDLTAGCIVVLGATQAYLYLWDTSQPDLPLAAYAALLNQIAVFPAVLAFALIFLLFPTGRPPSRRWAILGWELVAATVVLTVGFLLRPGTTDASHASGLTNPISNPSLESLGNTISQIGAWSLFFGSIAAVVSLVVRFRRSEGEERQQLRWIAAAGSLAVGAFLLSGVGEWVNGADWIGNLTWGLFLFSLAIGIPGAVAIAILKYRLYEIDVVIRKTIVYGALVAFTTLVYVGVVVGLGSAIGAAEGSFALSIAATAIVAVLFQRVREGAQRVANRIVYGKRATPYEVLAAFSDRVGGAYATEDVLSRMAHVLAEGVHAVSATIWLRVADRWESATTWPEAALSDDPPEEPPGDRVAPVVYRDEVLGALAVTMPADEPLTPEGAQLVDDLAGQAGIVLSNVRLTADLEARLDVIARQAEELRASRQRIVGAQDAERRRLERNIHDGAQQHLVALAVKLRLARGMLAKDPNRARAMLRELRDEIDAALDTLHALALGIYPPHLEADGIVAALAAQYERSPVPVNLHADGLGRHPIETEAAVYFCVLEGLQNAVKYADASAIEVTLGERDGALWFEVADDGVGFDPSRNGDGTGLAGMRDRLAVLGGDAELDSTPGRGTRVRGRVPLTEVARS